MRLSILFVLSLLVLSAVALAVNYDNITVGHSWQQAGSEVPIVDENDPATTGVILSIDDNDSVSEDAKSVVLAPTAASYHDSRQFTPAPNGTKPFQIVQETVIVHDLRGFVFDPDPNTTLSSKVLFNDIEHRAIFTVQEN